MAYIGKGITGEFASSDFSSVSFVGDGSTTAYTLPEIITTTDESLLIHIDGVKQHISAYSITSDILTFSAPPPNSSAIEVIIFGVEDLIQIYTVPEDSISVRELDTTDGTTGQVLTTDGVGNLSFSSKSTETLVSMGVTSTAAELNILDGVTSTAAELNYVSGVTSAIQTQINGKQPFDATIVVDGDIGTTVQAFDATIVVDADIGTTVQAYDADLTTLATNGIGTSANQIVKLDATAKLPAVDGSNLTGIESLPSQSSQSGKFLTTNGSAASWATGSTGWKLLSTISASASSTVDMETTLDSTYDDYMIVCSGVYGSSSTGLNFRLKIGGTYITSGYYAGGLRQSITQTSYDYRTNNNLSSFSNTTGNDMQDLATTPSVIRMFINKPSVSKYQSIQWDAHTIYGLSACNRLVGAVGINSTSGVLTGVRFYGATGTINGSFRLYGLANS